MYKHTGIFKEAAKPTHIVKYTSTLLLELATPEETPRPRHSYPFLFVFILFFTLHCMYKSMNI